MLDAKDKALIKEFAAAGAHLKGHFELSSGLHSDGYLQCARVLMDAARAERLCVSLAQKVIEHDLGKIDYVVSPAMGGVIVGYEMGRQLNVPSMFLEREAGIFTLRRGFELEAGARVLVVEDVVTTGLSSREAMTAIRKLGGEVLAVVCLVDRSEHNIELDIPLIGLGRFDIRVFDTDHIPPELKDVPAIKPGSRGLK